MGTLNDLSFRVTLTLIRLCGVRKDPKKLCKARFRLLYDSGPLLCLPTFLTTLLCFWGPREPRRLQTSKFFCKSG